MNYKKIVFSLILMSCSSFVMGMSVLVPGVLSRDEQRKEARRAQLEKAAIDKYEEIEKYNRSQDSGELSPKSVMEVSNDDSKVVCPIGRVRAYVAAHEIGRERSEKAAEKAREKAIKLEAEVTVEARQSYKNISLARIISVKSSVHEPITRFNK